MDKYIPRTKPITIDLTTNTNSTIPSLTNLSYSSTYSKNKSINKDSLKNNKKYLPDLKLNIVVRYTSLTVIEIFQCQVSIYKVK